MISIVKRTKYPNILGVTASGLCLIHCLMTPLFFTIQASTFGLRKQYLLWWQMIDLVFLLVSCIAIFVAASRTSKRWMKYSLWGSWILLAGIILNEKFQILKIMEAAIYIPSIALIVLHICNRNYCSCTNENCCAHPSDS
ncbi:MerC domain-containing protein [Aquimarina sp. RZ0]|uniref:MerC domain-containing protein n=1 Tax=Aquimarina sp. RZ0 TaxID=2607730 RepID=UPI0011F256D9|nr:MerC domain-containing protein [Aquimarina sp. RZ0]KAA1247905.1 MerC domain-containing protein [Aquimarina sp. RZ0]